jgi:protein arginine kinase activator
MKCEICGLRDAVIHIRQIQKSHSQELHICEECAQEKGFLREEEAELSISNLLSGLIEGKEATGEPETPEACPRCGTKAAEFRKRGKLGCPECFTTFQRDVRNMLSQMAGRTHHTGKVPRREAEASAPTGQDRQALETELREAIDREDYETAAVLRDRLRGQALDV